MFSCGTFIGRQVGKPVADFDMGVTELFLPARTVNEKVVDRRRFPGVFL